MLDMNYYSVTLHITLLVSSKCETLLGRLWEQAKDIHSAGNTAGNTAGNSLATLLAAKDLSVQF